MGLPEIIDARSPGFTPGVPRLPNIKALTSIRFFAALHVALFHLVRPFPRWGPLAPAFSAGYVGVSFFFVLSGFILTYSHAQEYESGRGSARRFWVARFARVYPVYLVSMVLAAYVNRAQFHQAIHWLVYVADLLMLQSWSTRTVLFFNVPAWSLSCEAFFYLVFPFVLLRLRAPTRRKSLAALAAFWIMAMLVPIAGLIQYPAAGWHLDVGGSVPGQVPLLAVRRLPILALPEFLAGISLGWLYLRFPLSRRAGSVLATTSLLGLSSAVLLSNHLPYVLLHNGLLIPLFSMLILGLCGTNWLSALLSNSFLVLLGEASYALYLIHTLVLEWTQNTLHMSDSIPNAILRLSFLIPISVLLHLCVERPCRRLLLQWYRRKHPSEMKIVEPASGINNSSN